MDVKETKQELKQLFKCMRTGIEAGRIPEMEQIEKFKKLIAVFESYSADKPWAEELKNFSAKVIELEKAVSEKNLAEVQRLALELRSTEKSCHTIYRKKE